MLRRLRETSTSQFAPLKMPEQTTVFYQLPRGVVIRHWRRRTLLDRRQLLWRALALLVAPGLFLLGGGLQYLAYVTLFTVC